MRQSTLPSAVAQLERAISKIHLIDLVSRAELHVYHTPRNPRWKEYQMYKRVAGEWRVQERVIGGSIRFP